MRLAATGAIRAATDAIGMPSSPRSMDAMQAALEAWDQAATTLQEKVAKSKRDIDERHAPQQRKVEVSSARPEQAPHLLSLLALRCAPATRACPRINIHTLSLSLSLCRRFTMWSAT